MPYPVIIVIVVAVLGLTVWSQLRLRAGKAQHADKNLGAMTARMGLAIEVGDPSLNLLYFQQPSGNFQRELRASGSPYNRPVQFQLRDGQSTSEYIVARKITTTFGCFLTTQLRVGVTPFEVVLRAPNQYLIANQELADEPLAEVSTGNPALDQRYVVRAADPRIGPALVPALEALGQQLYVHLAGTSSQVWMSFTRLGLPYLSYAPEEYLLALESAACGLEGQPAPARLPAAPVAGATPA
jgi:hypothetical protein